MVTEVKMSQTALYETDFVCWSETTAQYLRDKNYNQVDWENLIEEVEDMSRRARKALKSNLIVVLLHLLKWQYQSEMQSGSWRGSIREHRRRVNDDLQDSPSLVSYLQEVLTICYGNAREQAADETGLAIDGFPIDCPYTIAQILNPGFLPD
jgi:Domain of unknown function DUF29